MKQYKNSLDTDDLIFFYQILYQYEKENSHGGYDYSKVSDRVKVKINLAHDTKTKMVPFIMPQDTNCLVLKGNGGCVSKPMIEQVRHAFAHALVEVDGDKYIINKNLCSKCKLCGIVERKIFREYIKAIQKTRS